MKSKPTMKLNSLSEIISCINKWQDIRNDQDAVLGALSNVESFTFKMRSGGRDNLHVYPGVCPTTDKFCVFLIAKEEDVQQSEQNLYNAIIQTTIQDFVYTNDWIPESDAKKRIANWKKHRNEWIVEQIATEDGIFKAFNLPASYMTSQADYHSFFALKSNAATPSEFDADIITTDLPAKIVMGYHDFVRPVPPFGGSNPEAAFYLLQL